MVNCSWIFAAAAMVLLATPAAASAHAFLKTASPPVGSTMQTAPAEVEITFTEGVEPAFSTIEVVDAKGTRVDKADPHPTGDKTHLAVGLRPLPPGAYKVSWHVTATDTHKTEGTYSFTIAK
jgi:methionine-rich copper-binding protein CopC